MKEVMRTTTKKLQEIVSIATVKYVGVGSLRLVVVVFFCCRLEIL